MSNGVLYCATGKEYLERASLSARSLKRFHPEIAVAVCTNMPVIDTIWDKQISIPKGKTEHNQYMLDKLVSLLKSPFSNTLYLDSDTYIMDDINELFLLMEKFDFALCHSHNRLERYKIQIGELPYRGTYRKVISSSIPYAFSAVQGGLLLYSGSDGVRSWLKSLLTLYQSKDFFDDQVSMRELLWKTNLRYYMLPPEYNFNSIKTLKTWRRNKYREARPKIFHYTRHKQSNIPRLVRSYEKTRSIWGTGPYLPLT
jgi:lipopolysaccharide biosynthesis glycosyltransferase